MFIKYVLWEKKLKKFDYSLKRKSEMYERLILIRSIQRSMEAKELRQEWKTVQELQQSSYLCSDCDLIISQYPPKSVSIHLT